MSLFCFALCSAALAQSTEPTATPVDTPTPVASPTPAPSPGSSAQETVTTGVPSADAMATYNAARTPQATIVLSAAVPTASTSGLSTATAAAPSALSAEGGVFSLVRLPVSSQAKGATKSSISATTAASASAPPVATVTLTYGVGCAGQEVSIQPLNGGTLTASDANGKICTAPADGFSIIVATDGTLTFNYQPPATTGTYQVLTRYDNVTTTLPFLVADPQ